MSEVQLLVALELGFLFLFLFLFLVLLIPDMSGQMYASIVNSRKLFESVSCLSDLKPSQPWMTTFRTRWWKKYSDLLFK